MKTRTPKSAADSKGNRQKKVAVKQDSTFPVVAIGASAGGLEAYKELFHALPADTGMAFVLLQHLDPSHHSMLTEIIAKATQMPVEEVKSGARISPNRVFVIPPNAFMAVAGGVFTLTPQGNGQGQHLAVNFFMRSLAKERKNRAIGVVLSGTGADGTLGIEDIKAEGGITFAQIPTSAKYDGMPRSAIDSGCVDFVLTPNDIAKEIGRIRHHPYVSSAMDETEAESPSPGTDALISVLDQLRKSSRVDFSQYRTNTIQRRALRRMVVLKLESLNEYAKYLKGHPEEGKKLYDDVLIPVTSFFRDFEMFEALKKQVYPTIVRNESKSGSIRMWAPGCSTGEETYSLAMTLLEFLGDKTINFQIQIFGTDLNEKGIQKARSGVYRESIAEEISPERMSRFFVKVEGGYRVSKAVRDICIFARQNLAADPPFSQMDVVACRNLLIYIQPVLQKKVIPILHYALKPSGFLVLGSSESVSAFPELFSTVDKKHKIYCKKPVLTRLPIDFAQPFGPFWNGPNAINNAPNAQASQQGEVDLQAEADRLVLKEYAPVGVVINEAMDVVQFRGRTAPYLEPASGKASLNVLKLARNGLAIELRTLIGAATKKGALVKKDGISLESNGQKRVFNLSVSPLGEAGARDKHFFLILFEDVTQWTSAPGNVSKRGTKASTENKGDSKRLKRELADTQDALRAAIESEDARKEEFQSANEEILSANEELQSTNEELETSKEELQSANEELNTLNDELRNRNGELGQLNNDLTNVLDAIRIPILFVSADQRIRRFTSTATEIFRLLPSDIGRPIADLRNSIDVPDFAKLIQSTIENLVPTKREVRDGEGHWRSLEIRPFRTSDNRIEGAIVALPDIDNLKQNELYLKQIIDNVPNPLLVLDGSLRVLLANQSFCADFHVSPTETIGQLLYRLGNEQWNIPRLRELLEEVLPQHKRVRQFAVTHDFPEIGTKIMLVSGRRIEDTGTGGLPMILLSIEDVSERRRAEELVAELSSKVEQQARIFDTTLSSIADFAYTFDREGRFLYVNQALLDLWGLKLEEAVGKNFFELPYPEELAARLQRQIQQVFETGKSLVDESPYTSPAGVTGYYEYIFTPVRGVNGTVDLVSGSTREVTKRKLAEAAMIKSEKLATAGRFAAILAHEINNPLQAVTNLMTLVTNSPKLDAEDRRYTTMAAEELRRITHLARQSLSFYREAVSPTAVNVQEVVETVLSLYAKEIAARQIVVTKRFQLNGTIQTYPGEIRQVFSTLLINAMEAVHESGKIALHVSTSSARRENPAVHGVRFTVADNGVGIPAQNTDRIFEPFFTTKGEHGTGLGLWVAQAIVHRLGGSIHMRSSVRPETTGTCFSIFLPNETPK